jgi:rhodanese-related sulfurtransferase
MVKQITVDDLKKKLDGKEKIRLVDCREPDENGFCHIEGAELIPLSQFSEKATGQLHANDEIYIHCHHGGRSARACEFLMAQGYQNVVNVTGGIDAWSLRIDPKVPRY